MYLGTYVERRKGEREVKVGWRLLLVLEMRKVPDFFFQD
jgi:hypothetical protein